MLSPFPEAPRKRLWIFKIMMECAENIPLKTDRRGSSAEVPAIAHLTAEAKTQAAEAWRKLWRKRVDRNRQRVLNTAQIAFPFQTPFIQCAPPPVLSWFINPNHYPWKSRTSKSISVRKSVESGSKKYVHLKSS